MEVFSLYLIWIYLSYNFKIPGKFFSIFKKSGRNKFSTTAHLNFLEIKISSFIH